MHKTERASYLKGSWLVLQLMASLVQVPVTVAPELLEKLYLNHVTASHGFNCNRVEMVWWSDGSLIMGCFYAGKLAFGNVICSYDTANILATKTYYAKQRPLGHDIWRGQILEASMSHALHISFLLDGRYVWSKKTRFYFTNRFTIDARTLHSS